MLHCSPTNSLYFLPPEFPPASKHKKLKMDMIDSNGLVFGRGENTPFGDEVPTAFGSADSLAIGSPKLSLGVSNKIYIYR